MNTGGNGGSFIPFDNDDWRNSTDLRLDDDPRPEDVVEKKINEKFGGVTFMGQPTFPTSSTWHENLMSVELIETNRRPQWIGENRVYDSNAITMLGQEISDFMEFIKPREAEEALRQLTVQRLSLLVKNLWPSAVISCFGSFETKLYLPSGDIDLVIMCDEIKVVRNALVKLAQAAIEEELSSRENIEVITSARVPLVKYVDLVTGYHADVSFNNDSGPVAAKFIKEQLRDPKLGNTLKVIVIIVKQFLYQRRLERVYLGGLGGYSVFLMALSFLKLHPKIQLNLIDPNMNIGTLLLEFFELYGRLLNTFDVAIAFFYNGKPRYLQKNNLNLIKKTKRQGICVVDPLNSKNDIGGGTFAWHIVRREFSRAYRLLNAVLGKLYENTSTFGSQPIDKRGVKRFADRFIPKPSTLLGMILCFENEELIKRDKAGIRWSSIVKLRELTGNLGDKNVLRIKESAVREYERKQERSRLCSITSSNKKIKRKGFSRNPQN